MKWPVLAALALAAFVVTPATTEAAFKVRISGTGFPGSQEIWDQAIIPGNPPQIPDGASAFPGLVTGSTTGVISFSPLQTVTVGIGSAVSKPFVGDPYHAVLSFNGVTVTTQGAGTWNILITDTDYSIVPGVN